MKHFAKFGCGLLAVMMAACSSEEPIPVDGTGSGNGQNDVYATLTLRLPSGGSRADDVQNPVGIEYGQAEENAVGRILVVLATKDADNVYHFLTAAEADASEMDETESDKQNLTKQYLLNFSSAALSNNPLDDEGDGTAVPGKEVYVFVYCNPTTNLLAKFAGMDLNATFTNTPAEITEKWAASGPNIAEIWTPKRFLMTNCEISKPVTIPSRSTLVGTYNTPSNPFDLGTVKVKRVVARFDFQATTTDAGLNSYEIKNIDGESRMGVVKLTHMAMFNIAKSFYYIPRTNSQWNWKGTTTLCGDLEGNVMSPNTGGWRNPDKSLGDVNKYFFSYLINNDFVNHDGDENNLEWVDLSEFASIEGKDPQRPADSHSSWGGDYNGGDHNYRIWRYATENTIPAAADGGVSSQKIGITTGVVFKGEFVPDDTKVWDGHVIYVHKNIVYGNFDELAKYVEKNPNSIVASDFKKAFKGVSANPDLDVNLLKNKDDDQCANFKAYEAVDGKYIMYYFYYNRHNSNYDDAVMDTNEFGVVRNNVYKLKVETVGSLGSPTTPTTPDNPDEEEKAYFKVSCIVMPWTVRVNNINF